MDSFNESAGESEVKQTGIHPLSDEQKVVDVERYVFLSPDVDAAHFQGMCLRKIDDAGHRLEPAHIHDRFVTAICVVTEEYADDNAEMLGQWLQGIFAREMLFLILCKRERERNSFQGIPAALIYLIVPRQTPGPFLRQLVENAFREMSLRLDRLSYQTRLELSLQDMRRIIRIGQLLSTEKDFEVLIEKILYEAMAVVGADAGSIYVTEPYRGDRPEYLRFKKSALQLNASEFLLPVDSSSIAGYVASSGAPLMIRDCYALTGAEPYRFNREYDLQHHYFTRSMLVIPMKNYRNEIIGVIQLINKKPEAGRSLSYEEMRAGAVLPFTTADMDKASAVAGQAAVAIENNRLINDIHNLFEGFVRASVTAIEQRDPTTSGHSFRVAEYTVGLALAIDRLSSGPYQHLKFTREQIREIRYASLLHDFGKVGVREQVLVKAKKLYPDQLNEIRWRFRYARKSLEQKYTQKKLNFLRENGEGPFRDYQRYMDAELAQKIEELQGMLQIIELSNEPSVVDSDTFGQIEQIALHRIQLDDGTVIPFLTDNELVSLQVRRGNLDQRERLEIESHVTHTYRFLVQIPWTGDLKRIPDIAYGHHEKLDGSGYPLGLNQSEILPQTRMMTIADIYDALTAPDRPYKKSLRPEEALDILLKEGHDGRIDLEMLKIFIEAKVFEKRWDGSY
jgi:HD-GYP domain-containing protein (c-di-GMP phosphodiesterase class II)